MKKADEKISDELEALLKGCKKNNRASQKILYDRYFEGLYVHSQRYRLDDQDKLALINQTMLNVFQNIDSYTGDGELESWIHAIHNNNILNHFRTINRKKAHVIPDTDAVEWWGRENGYPHDGMDMEYINIAIKSLPDKTREVLELYAIQGYKHKEIARMLDMSESNSKYHLSKARELMAEKIKKNHG